MRFYPLLKKEKEATMLDEISLDDLSKNKYSEKGFKLPLPALVEGKNRSGRRFKEKTILSYISHQGSSFWLTNSVLFGSELKLTLDLPSNLSKEKNLKLIIMGKVAFVEAANRECPKERVSLHFENKYIIKILTNRNTQLTTALTILDDKKQKKFTL